MSESEDETKVAKGVIVLKGADNFVGWKRNLQMKLASKELDEYLDKVPASHPLRNAWTYRHERGTHSR